MRAIAAPIMAMALVVAPAASAQSMNIPLITRVALTEICGPYLQTGDLASAVQASVANRYRVAPTVDPADPPPFRGAGRLAGPSRAGGFDQRQ